MEYPNQNPKAKAVKKFIEAYYRQVKDVDITYYTEDIPKIVVYFTQDDEKIANEDIIFRDEIIKDIKNYFGYTAIPTFLFKWEKDIPKFQNPDMSIKAISLNYDPFL